MNSKSNSNKTPDKITLLKILLKERGPLTLTQIGESLWGGKRNRQSYARPAGAMVARMVKAGNVRQALSNDLGYKRNTLDPALWMLNSQKNTQIKNNLTRQTVQLKYGPLTRGNTIFTNQYREVYCDPISKRYEIATALEQLGLTVSHPTKGGDNRLLVIDPPTRNQLPMESNF